MSVRILRHDHGAIVSGASYCFKTHLAADREACCHEAPRGTESFTDTRGDTVWLAWSRPLGACSTTYYGRGGHEIGVCAA